VIDNVDEKGIWRRWDQHQKVQTLKLEGAHIIDDRWQAGISIPVMTRQYAGSNYSGLGDITTSASYEYLSNWNYSEYQPRGIGFIQLMIPTGKSRAESELGGLDSRGNGYWALGAGTMVTKSFNKWDVFAQAELHRSFQKKINTSLIQGTVQPGFGHSLGFGAGYNWQDYRTGVSAVQTQEDEAKINSDVTGFNMIQGLERWMTFSASFSYLQDQEWAWSLTYSDQTLLGEPQNTSLGKTILLQLQKRWAR
jgi:hypothetical protein